MIEDTSKEPAGSDSIYISGLQLVERAGKIPAMSSMRGLSFN